jgi:hypothetical protein
MSFLIVGHTHEDIDANLLKMSVHIRHQEIAILLGLMAKTWESKSVHPITYLIQEVANYKNFARPFSRVMKGQSKPIQFLF